MVVGSLSMVVGSVEMGTETANVAEILAGAVRMGEFGGLGPILRTGVSAEAIRGRNGPCFSCLGQKNPSRQNTAEMGQVFSVQVRGLTDVN